MIARLLRPGYGLATIALLAAWFALSSPWLLGYVTIPYDAKAHFQAQIQFLSNALHSGQSPFWAPHVFVGTPQIADPQSLIFSPAFFLAYFEAVPTFRQLDAYVLILLGLGAFAVLKLFQDRGWHAAGGLVAAIAFAFGASAAWRIQHIGQIQSYAFFAIALWLLQRSLDRSSVRWGVAAGLAAGLMLAEPNQVALLGAYVLAGLVVTHWLTTWPEQGWRRTVRPLAAATATGLLIVAVPIVLCYLYVESSNRPIVDYAEAAQGSLNPASLLTTLVADLFGAHDPKVDYWGPYSIYWNKNDLALSQNMGQLYIGILPMLLVLTVGVLRGVLWAREVRVYTVAIALLVLYALGEYTPAFRLFYEFMPGVAMFRRPADASFLVGGLLAIAGGYVLHRWLTGTLPSVSLRRRFGEAALITAVFATALAVAVDVDKLALAVGPTLNAAGWVAAAIVLLSIPPRWLKPAGFAAVLIPALLMTADLAANNGPNESTGLPAASYDILKPNCSNETIRFLKTRMRRAPGTEWRDRVELVGLGFEWPNAALVHGIDTTLGYNPLRIGLVARALGARDYIAGPDQRHFAPLFPSYRSTLSNLVGLRFVASSVPVEQVDLRLQRGDLKFVARTQDAYIYENVDALPRVLFVRDWQYANFEDIMTGGRWPEFDPTATVLLDGEPEIAGASPAPSGVVEHEDAKPQVRILSYANTIVEIETEAAEEGFVVLNDVWHPWWQATLDGEPATIHRANVLFRAVHVPRGKHVIRFEFTPFSGAIAQLGSMLRGQGR